MFRAPEGRQIVLEVLVRQEAGRDVVEESLGNDLSARAASVTVENTEKEP